MQHGADQKDEQDQSNHRAPDEQAEAARTALVHPLARDVIALVGDRPDTATRRGLLDQSQGPGAWQVARRLGILELQTQC